MHKAKIRYNVPSESKQYAILTLAALALGVSKTAVKKAMDSGKVLLKTYVIKFINKKYKCIIFSVNWIVFLTI